MEELPKCSFEGCEKKARSLKGGYCVMHYTRLRTHGDAGVNLYEGRGKHRWELPDGTIISESKKIESLNIIIERITNRRLLGYQKNDDTLDIIEKVLDDYHGTYKGGRARRGKKTMMYAGYVNTLANSEWGFEHGLITIEKAGLISKLVSELSKSKDPIKLWNACKNLGIKYDDEKWLVGAITKHPIIGITYYPEDKTVGFTKDISWFYKELEKLSKQGKKLTNDDAIKIGLHYERISSYNKYDNFKSEQYSYHTLVSVATTNVIKYLMENGQTEENTLYEKCDTNQIMLQQMIESDIGISKNDDGMVGFTITPKMKEIMKKETEMWNNYTDQGLAASQIENILGINYVERNALQAINEHQRKHIPK